MIIDKNRLNWKKKGSNFQMFLGNRKTATMNCFPIVFLMFLLQNSSTQLVADETDKYRQTNNIKDELRSIKDIDLNNLFNMLDNVDALFMIRNTVDNNNAIEEFEMSEYNGDTFEGIGITRKDKKDCDKDIKFSKLNDNEFHIKQRASDLDSFLDALHFNAERPRGGKRYTETSFARSGKQGILSFRPRGGKRANLSFRPHGGKRSILAYRPRGGKRDISSFRSRPGKRDSGNFQQFTRKRVIEPAQPRFGKREEATKLRDAIEEQSLRSYPRKKDHIVTGIAEKQDTDTFRPRDGRSNIEATNVNFRPRGSKREEMDYDGKFKNKIESKEKE